MRNLTALLVVCGAFAAIASPGALANRNPSGTGPPSQSCQEQEPNTRGKAAESPGAPFNEPGINSEKGGTGGQHYSEKSQYDVACYQQAQHAAH
jgi:hypothetical protein